MVERWKFLSWSSCKDTFAQWLTAKIHHPHIMSLKWKAGSSNGLIIWRDINEDGLFYRMVYSPDALDQAHQVFVIGIGPVQLKSYASFGLRQSKRLRIWFKNSVRKEFPSSIKGLNIMFCFRHSMLLKIKYETQCTHQKSQQDPFWFYSLRWRSI